MAREQSLVVTGLEAIAKQLPFTVLGIDSDNDSVFINDTLTQYCADRRHRVHPFPGVSQERPGVG